MINKHIFFDNLTALIGSLASGKNKFFSGSIQSETIREHLKNISMDMPDITEGIHELEADTLAGTIDPGFHIMRMYGKDHPTIIYHHGNNERPFDFSRNAKNSYKSVLVNSEPSVEVNLIGIRAPFHNSSLKQYQRKIAHLSNFVVMMATSVKLIDQLVQKLRKDFSSYPIVVSGISLGGWVTNLHRTYFNSADAYVPLLAGAALDHLFTNTIYRRMTSKTASENPGTLYSILNFEEDFQKIDDDNVFPLLGRYDQYISYERQKVCYNDRPVRVLDRGHITSLLEPHELRKHILSVTAKFAGAKVT